MNLGGGGYSYSEPRSHHCTPAWATSSMESETQVEDRAQGGDGGGRESSELPEREEYRQENKTKAGKVGVGSSVLGWPGGCVR